MTTRLIPLSRRSSTAATLGLRNLSVVLGLSASIACGGRGVGAPSHKETDNAHDPATFTTLRLETTASAFSVDAGTPFSVTCLASSPEVLAQPWPYAGAVLHIEAEVQQVRRVSDGVFEVTPTVAEVLSIKCRSQDDRFEDPRGVTVTVNPGPASSISTDLQQSEVRAGESAGVTCTVFDAFDNVDGSAETHLRLDPLLSADPVAGASYSVRSETPGTYSLQCTTTAGPGETDISDDGAMLTILTGLPALSHTTLDRTMIRPDEVATVACAVTDAFGNAIDSHPATATESGHEGSSAATTVTVLSRENGTGIDGLVVDGQQIQATRAGTYFVFCAVKGYRAGDETPAILTVRPGMLDRWVAELPAQTCYWEDRGLPLTWMAFDAWGNGLDDDQSFLSMESPSDPMSASIDTTGLINVSGEGLFTIDVRITSTEDPSKSLTLPQGPIELTVDSTPPILNTTSPRRGEIITQGDLQPATVLLLGSAEDAISPIESLDMAGQTVAISGANYSENFSVEHTSRWGISTIEGSVTDACGNRRVIAQSYLRASSLAPPATAPDAANRIDNGLLAHLNQPVIDDSDRLDLDDIASLGEAVMLASDFNTMLAPGQALVDAPLPNPLPRCDACCWFDCGCFADTWLEYGYRLSRHPDPSRAIHVEGPWITELTAIDGGIHFDVLLNQLDFPLRFWAGTAECGLGITLPEANIWVDGWTGADYVRASGDLWVGLDVDGSPQAMLPTGIDLDTQGLYFSIDCGWAQFLCNSASAIVLEMLQDTAEAMLSDAIASALPGTIEEFIGAFNVDTAIALPAPMNTTVNFVSGFDFIDFVGSDAAGPGYGQLGLYTEIFPDAHDARESAQGDSIDITYGATRKGGVQPSFDRTAYAFGLGLKDDLINQLFWAVWYGGGLTMDLTEMGEAAGAEGISMSLYSLLPPVVMPGRDDFTFDVGIGDAYIDASVDLGLAVGGDSTGIVRVGMYLSTVVGAEVDIDPDSNSLLFDLEQGPQVWVQVVEISDPQGRSMEGYQGVMSDLFAGIFRLIMPGLLDSMLGALPLPSFDLSTTAGLPPGSVLEIGNASIGRGNDSTFSITGTLQ